MIFAERKIESGFTYEVEDIFGTISIESDKKLTGDILDDMVLLLLRQNGNAGEISGEVKHDGGIVKYVFKKRPIWEKDEETPCESTPTSIPKQESASTRILHLPRSILSWFKRFVGAFLEAWRKAGKTYPQKDGDSDSPSR